MNVLIRFKPNDKGPDFTYLKEVMAKTMPGVIMPDSDSHKMLVRIITKKEFTFQQARLAVAYLHWMATSLESMGGKEKAQAMRDAAFRLKADITNIVTDELATMNRPIL